MPANSFFAPAAAMITLYRDDGAIDTGAMARFGQWLLAEGCAGLLMFGTTGEGQSLSAAERIAALRQIIGAGVPADKILVGAGCAALSDTAELTSAAGALGCAGALILPPFFFRQAPAAGLLAYMDALLTKTRPAATPVYLYYFPEMSGIAYDETTIDALTAAHPGRILGIKDSCGDKAHTLGWIKRFPDLSVFTGDDHVIGPLVAAGCAGPMTATAGFAPKLVAEVFAAAQRAPRETPAREGMLSALWFDTLLAAPVTEAVKFLFTKITGDARWNRIRAPLLPLDRDTAASTWERFTALDDGTIAAAIRAMPPVFP